MSDQGEKQPEKPASSPYERKGYFVKGGKAGPGRPPLPDWFKAAAPLALEHIVAIAKGEATDEKMTRAGACVDIVDRVHGKATVMTEISSNISPAVEKILEIYAKEEEAKEQAGHVDDDTARR